MASLRGPDLIITASSTLFMLATFLPWYTATIGPLRLSEGAWNVGALGVMAALCGLATAVASLLVVLGFWRLGPHGFALLAVVLAPTTLFFTFLRLVIDPSTTAAQLTLGLLRVGRGAGLWIAFALAIAMTVGAVQKFRAVAARG